MTVYSSCVLGYSDCTQAVDWGYTGGYSDCVF